jgi:ketosteroid isomerase-like protein
MTPHGCEDVAVTALEALRAVFRAWEANDPGALGPLFCDDGVYLDPLKEEPLRGRKAIVEGNRPAMAAIADLAITERTSLDHGDSAIVEGDFNSRLAGSEQRFDFPFAAVAEMRDGMIARLAEYFDTKPLRP